MASSLLLCVLVSFAAFAALGAALRAEPEGRAELGLLASTVFFGLIIVPVFALGYTNRLTPGALALLSFVVSAATFAASLRGRAPRAFVREIARAGVSLARLPWDALGLAWRAQSSVVLGLLASTFAIVASAWITYLAPSESWDSFFYHEPMIGFALQNHGFQMVDLPRTLVVQATNGYPRGAEAFALFFVAFTGKTFVEIGNTLAAPALSLGVFLLARRFASDPVPCMGWAAVVLLMPATTSQLRTSMIDVVVGAFLLAALHFATRAEARMRDAVITAGCLALVLASKSASLFWAPPMALVAGVNLLRRHAKARPRATALLLASSLILLTGVAALTFGRNWLAFGNPLWPVDHAIPRLGIHFRGVGTLAQLSLEPPLATIARVKYHHPTGGVADIIARDYGYAVPWVVVPLASIAALVAAFTALRARLSKKPDAGAERVLVLVALGAVFLRLTPNLNIARFNIHIVALAVATIAWLAARASKSARLHEAAVAAALVLSLVPWAWYSWFFGLEPMPEKLSALVRMSPAERASAYSGGYHLPPDVAQKRERELGPGSLVVFTDESAFIGAFWNDAMSNHLKYLRFEGRDAFLARIAELHPTWVVVGAKSQARMAIESRNAEWELVGMGVRQDNTVVYRRRGG
ncbi:hypothetical protein QHF84_21985 [Polyangium sp. y55x31]|nr:hypothetical protein [Polyangium sp. y55x31]